jgi:hypothetical protein
MITARGSRLLQALLDQTSTNTVSQLQKNRNRDGTLVPKLDVSMLVRTFCRGSSMARDHQGNASSSLFEDPPPTYHAGDVRNLNAVNFAQLDFNFPFLSSGLGGSNGFDNLLYLANHDSPLP